MKSSYAISSVNILIEFPEIIHPAREEQKWESIEPYLCCVENQETNIQGFGRRA